MPSVVYASVPRANGMFTCYKNLRDGLKDYGWEVRCLTIGQQEHRLYDNDFADEGCISLVPQETDLEAQIQALIQWCASQEVDVLIPMNSEACLAAIPQLPPEVQVIMRCAFTSEYGYRLVTQNLDRVASIIALTPRHVTDLTLQYGIPSEKIALIEHGTNLGRFVDVLDKYLRNQPRMEIAFLGQLQHSTKGVFLIPEILKYLDQAHVDYRLWVAGWGPDAIPLAEQLRDSMQQRKVSFLGVLRFKSVPDFLAKADVYLAPSLQEGFSNSLMEAMAAGCVPVVSHIQGVTDFILNDQETGFLCPIGDAEAFAQAITVLYRDRQRLPWMGKGAHEAVAGRFNAAAMVKKYADLLQRVTSGLLV